MKRFVIVSVLLLTVAAVGALPGRAQLLSSRRQPVRVSASAYYQRYTDEGRRLSEVSFPLSVYLPMGRRFGLSVQTGQARVSAGDLESVSGLDDVQVTLNHARKVGVHSLVFSVGANLPSGKSELTKEEFQTSVVLSRNFFPFHVPSFGQGFNVAPGVTWAMPLSDDFVVGAGVVYHFRGSYKPVEDIVRYAPGDELLLAGGLEVRLNPTMALSADATHTIYAKDKFGVEKEFALGSQTTVRLRGRAYFGFDELRLVVQYQHREKSRATGEEAQTARQTIPNQAYVLVSYRTHLRGASFVTVLGQGRFFGSTEAFRSLLGEDLFASSKSMIDLGLMPEVRLTGSVRLVGRFLYTVGDITGVEAGLGLTLTM